MKDVSGNKIQTGGYPYRTFTSWVLVTAVITSLLIQPTPAQLTDAVTQLKQQILLLEGIDVDSSVLPEVRKINQKLLNERRIQLQGLLKNNLNSMMEYSSKVRSALSDKEKETIDALIANLENDIRDIENKLRAEKPNDLTPSPTYLASTNPESPRRADVQNTPIKETKIVDNYFPNQNVPSKLGLINSAAPTSNQPACYPNANVELSNAVKAAAESIVDNDTPGDVGTQSAPIFFFAIVDAISDEAGFVASQKDAFEKDIDIKRLQQRTKETNKQIGSTAGSEGTTSAIEKPGFAELLGFAIENGAINKAVDGTTLTLSTSPYAFVAAAKGDTATVYKNNGYLSRLGVSTTFNIDNEDNVLLNASRKQLSEWNLKLRLSGDRSNRSEEAEAIWNRDVMTAFNRPALALTGALAELFSFPEVETKRRTTMDNLARIDPVSAALGDGSLTRDQKVNEIARLLICRVKSEIVDKVRSGELGLSSDVQKRIVESRLLEYQQAMVAKENAVEAFEKKLEALTYKPAWTLAYTNKRAAETSDYSTVKILFEKKVAEKLNWTANAGFSVYHKPNRMLNQKQNRDFAVAFSFEGLFGRSPFLSQADDLSQMTYAFTGSYQRLFENKGVMDKKPDIGAGQFKLVIPFFTGVSLPFSVTYSNATAESRKAGVRANFGVTLDADKIFQVLKIRDRKAQ